MPSGPGTYGSKRGRPPMKEKGMAKGGAVVKKKAGGKVMKKMGGGTLARGSGAARPQKFRKNG